MRSGGVCWRPGVRRCMAGMSGQKPQPIPVHRPQHLKCRSPDRSPGMNEQERSLRSVKSWAKSHSSVGSEAGRSKTDPQVSQWHPFCHGRFQRQRQIRQRAKLAGYPALWAFSSLNRRRKFLKTTSNEPSSTSIMASDITTEAAPSPTSAIS